MNGENVKNGCLYFMGFISCEAFCHTLLIFKCRVLTQLHVGYIMWSDLINYTCLHIYICESALFGKYGCI